MASEAEWAQGFEWDTEKELKNIRERGLDFATASLIWRGAVVESRDNRRDYGEVRIRAYGKVEGRLLAVVFTWRSVRRRIISARKANRREQRLFETEIRRRESERD